MQILLFSKDLLFTIGEDNGPLYLYYKPNIYVYYIGFMANNKIFGKLKSNRFWRTIDI